MSERTSAQARAELTGKLYTDIIEFVKEDYNGDTGKDAPPMRSWDELDPMEQELLQYGLMPMVHPIVQVAILPPVEVGSNE